MSVATPESTVTRPAPAFLTGAPKKLFIGGEWVTALSGETLETVDPTTAGLLCTVAAGGPEDAERAVGAALAAYEEPSWSAMAPEVRTRVLLQIADVVERHADELATLDSLDMGAPFLLTRWMTAHAVDVYRHFAGWPTKIFGQTAPSDPSQFNFTLRQPLGVVTAINPWNAPMMQSSWKLGAALATGNTVVLKAAEQAPLSTLRLGELLTETDLPPGVVNIVTGWGGTVGEALVVHPDVAKVSFTGSAAVGRHIMERAAGTFKRITLELGGKSPNIVFADADLPAAAAAAAAGFSTGSGQVCVAGTRIFVERSVREEFGELLQKELSDYQLGDPFDPQTRMGPLVSREQYDRVRSYLDLAREEGARVTSSGAPGMPGGWFVAPTVLDDVTNGMRVAQEEIFGPVAALMPFDDPQEVVRLANDTIYGLAAAVWSRDITKAHRVARALRAGTVWVNTYNQLTPGILPFGGFKQSGIGRENGTDVLDAYTETKTVMLQL